METPLSSGSGIRISKDRLVTNAHVVEPFDAARVVFGGIEEHAHAEVIGVDLMHDIALLRLSRSADATSDAPPRHAGATVATIADPFELPIGSELFLVGFPGEVETHPSAAISRGILSRLRHWDRSGVGLVQTDADIGGGQSGGALVDPDGRVVGLSSMFFGDAGFAIALSMPDVLRLASDIEAGTLALDPGHRTSSGAELGSGGRSRLSWTLGDITREATARVRPLPGEPVRVELRIDQGEGPAWVDVLDPFGAFVDRWDVPGDARTLEFEFDALSPGDHTLIIGMDTAGGGVLQGSAPMVLLRDPDDGRRLITGEPMVAAIDIPGERDAFELVLQSGAAVEIIADALSFQTYLTLETVDEPERAPRVGDTWPGNALGHGSVLRLDAARRDRYRVTVGDLDDAASGGYVIEVRELKTAGSLLAALAPKLLGRAR